MALQFVKDYKLYAIQFRFLPHIQSICWWLPKKQKHTHKFYYQSPLNAAMTRSVYSVYNHNDDIKVWKVIFGFFLVLLPRFPSQFSLRKLFACCLLNAYGRIACNIRVVGKVGHREHPQKRWLKECVFKKKTLKRAKFFIPARHKTKTKVFIFAKLCSFFLNMLKLKSSRWLLVENWDETWWPLLI